MDEGEQNTIHVPEGLEIKTEELKSQWQAQWVDMKGYEKAVIIYPDGFTEELSLQ